MNKIKDLKISKYVEQLSSSSPTPGGGATACLVGSFSASLIEMVCNLTLGKEKYKSSQKETEDIFIKVKDINLKLINLCDEDIKAFNEVVQSFKLPEGENKKLKKEKSFKKATEVPLEVYKLCKELEVYSKRLFEIGNKNALSDVKSAFHFAKAARLSALENIRINLPYILDTKFIKKVKIEIA